MAEKDKPRPVSGEIMAEPAIARRSRAEEGDVVEAEYESVAPRPRPSPLLARHTMPASLRGMEMLRDVGGRVERVSRGGPAFWGVSLALVAAAFWISGGHTLVGAGRDGWAKAPAQPLAIEKVESRIERRDGRGIVFVEGEAHNRGDAAMPVPPIAIAITDDTGTTRRHFLGTNGLLLAPGESFGFSSRVEAPSNGVKNVTVTFREDMN
jgi:hypothetical protein